MERKLEVRTGTQHLCVRLQGSDYLSDYRVTFFDNGRYTAAESYSNEQEALERYHVLVQTIIDECPREFQAVRKRTG